MCGRRRDLGEEARVSFEEKVRLLSIVDIFEGLPRAELEELHRRCPDTRIEPEEVFYSPSGRGERLFVLEEGRVKVYRADPGGEEFTLSLVEGGSVFGDLALTGQTLQDVYVQATERSLIRSLRSRDLEGLILRNPEVGLRLARVLGERLQVCESLIIDLMHKEVPARLASLILRLLQSEGIVSGGERVIPTRYTHKEFGSMIGARRVAVTRAFKILQEAGAVEVEGDRRLHVRDLDALQSLARAGA